MNTSCSQISSDLLNITPRSNPDATAKPRVVLQTNGKPRRFVLTQPPGYRRGTEPRPLVDSAAAGAAQALNHARDDRGINSKSNGARPRAC